MPFERRPGSDLPDIDLAKYLPWVPRLLPLLIIAWILYSSFYQIGPDGQGVILTFGAYRAGNITEPGLHWKWPAPIQNVIEVPVKKIHSMEFGYRTLAPQGPSAGQRTRYAAETSAHEDEKLMLTGDLNAAEVEWSVQYRIDDPAAYLFNVKDVPDTIRDASEAVMRRLVGDRSVDEVITAGRAQLATDATLGLQKLLNQYGCGVTIIVLKLQDADPPAIVKEAFDEVNRARQEKDKIINEAKGERNRVLPAAGGTRDRQIAEAQGYLEEHVAIATGQAAAFLSRLEAYQQAPEVTRTRLYLEAMEEILGQVGEKIVVDEHLRSLLPLMNLTGPGAGGPAAGGSAAGQTPAAGKPPPPLGSSDRQTPAASAFRERRSGR